VAGLADVCDGVAFVEEKLWLVKDDSLWQERRDLRFVETMPCYAGSLHLVYLDLSMLGMREEEGGEHPSFEPLLDMANSATCKHTVTR